MKKLISLLLALSLVLSLGAAMAEDKVTLQLWHSMTGGNSERFDTMVAAFNASQDKIEVVASYQGDYWDAIASAKMAIVNGNGPDLMQCGSDEVLALTGEEGIVANLLDYMSEESGLWFEDFYPGFIECYHTVVDGKDFVGALPLGCSIPVMFVNMDLLKANGLEVPTTWTEMEKVCETLLANGAKHGFSWERDAWYYTFMMIPNYSGQNLYSADGLYLDCREGGIATFEFMQDMTEKKYFYPAPAADGKTIMRQMFGNGEMAFNVSSCGSMGSYKTIADEYGFELGVVSVPGGVTNSVPNGGNTLTMLESSEHKAEAYEFLTWLYTDPQGVATFDDGAGYMPCTRSLAASDILSAKMANDPLYANVAALLENINSTHVINGVAECSPIYLQFSDAVLMDMEDVTEQWDILEEEMHALLVEVNEE